MSGPNPLLSQSIQGACPKLKVRRACNRNSGFLIPIVQQSNSGRQWLFWCPSPAVERLRKPHHYLPLPYTASQNQNSVPKMVIQAGIFVVLQSPRRLIQILGFLLVQKGYLNTPDKNTSTQEYKINTLILLFPEKEPHSHSKQSYGKRFLFQCFIALTVSAFTALTILICKINTGSRQPQPYPSVQQKNTIPTKTRVTYISSYLILLFPLPQTFKIVKLSSINKRLSDPDGSQLVQHFHLSGSYQKKANGCALWVTQEEYPRRVN